MERQLKPLLCWQACGRNGSRLKVQGPFGCRIQWRVGRHRLKERAAPVSYVTTQSCTCGIYLATVTTSIALRERVPGSVPVVDLDFIVRTEVSM